MNNLEVMGYILQTQNKMLDIKKKLLEISFFIKQVIFIFTEYNRICLFKFLKSILNTENIFLILISVYFITM